MFLSVYRGWFIGLSSLVYRFIGFGLSVYRVWFIGLSGYRFIGLSGMGLSVYRFIGLSVYRFIGLSGMGISVYRLYHAGIYIYMLCTYCRTQDLQSLQTYGKLCRNFLSEAPKEPAFTKLLACMLHAFRHFGGFWEEFLVLGKKIRNFYKKTKITKNHKNR